jgi:arabinan endo-1,5-alpha-L-arabinosidase
MKLEGDLQHVHDPCVIKANDLYWLYSTGNGIPMRCSKDLIHWKYIGEVFSKLPDWAQETVPKAKGFWAPDIAYFKGKYVLHYSLSSFGSNQSAIGRATNKVLDPKHPDYLWKDEGVILQTAKTDNWNAIDANFIDGGKAGQFLAAGSFWSGIQMARVGESKVQQLAFRPEGAHAIEAPFMFKRGKFWYLLVSWDFCCRGIKSTYHLRIGRSKSLTEPFLDKDGKKLIDGGGTLLLETAPPVHGPGHGAVLSEKGKDWLVFHYYDGDANGIPTLGIRALSWTKDDWPTVAA